MITLRDLHDIYGAWLGSDSTPPIAPDGARGDVRIMGVVNLSRDSTYRESVAVDTEAAERLARIQHAEGAHLVDFGAESSNARARRVTPQEQIALLEPAIRSVAAQIPVSVETYHPQVAAAALAAGAKVVNLTGRSHELEIFDLAAKYDAQVVLCFGGESNVRDDTTAPIAGDPVELLLEHFGKRIDLARSRGVREVIVDPGIGFHYDNLATWQERVSFQTNMLIQSFRLHPLGVPVLNVLPHTFDIFGDQFRKAEGFFAVLALLGGSDILRVHEISHVRTVIAAMRTLSLDPPGSSGSSVPTAAGRTEG